MSTSEPTSKRHLTLAGIFLLALALRLWLPDWGRFLPPVDGVFPGDGAFDGHARGYVRAFLGEAPDPSTQAWPLLTALYGALGLVSDDVRLPVLLNVVAGSVTPVFLAVWARRHVGALAALWAGILAAVLPEHVAWSSSVLNVALPLCLLVAAFATERGWLAALLLILAVSMRAELALLAVWRGRWGLVALPVAAAWLWWLPSPDLGDPLLALRLNLPLVGYLGPPVLVLGILGLLGPHRDTALGLLGFTAWVHLTAAGFLDQGARHELAGGLALCALCGIAAARWSNLPGILVFLGLGLETLELEKRWVSPELEVPDDPGTLPADCVEVTDEPPIDGQPMPSHVLLHTGELDAACVVWGEAPIHRAWTSRGLQDRALRMRALYELEPVAVRETPGGPILLHRLVDP